MGGVWERSRPSYEGAKSKSSSGCMGGVNWLVVMGLGGSTTCCTTGCEADFLGVDDFLVLLLDDFSTPDGGDEADEAPSEVPARRSKSSRRRFNFLPVAARFSLHALARAACRAGC